MLKYKSGPEHILKEKKIMGNSVTEQLNITAKVSQKSQPVLELTNQIYDHLQSHVQWLTLTEEWLLQ